MADLLIAHLEKKSKEHSALEMLANQWGFDKNLIPKALQNIGSLFPHYSRHDESHSKQILINIERILGKNIELLTATDTWLILESAYWHDIGMVVPQTDRQEALESPEFRNFINDIAASGHHQLSEFAKKFGLSGTSNYFNSNESPLDSAYKLNELMAEWFRRTHPNRANSIIQSPWNTIGVSSPRTELIPSRLFRTLGHICEMHGAPFEKLMGSDGLPFREGGLAQEDCHPRFVACLLRMGDLLDLDNNRFCPVMQRIAGEDRPCISKAHEEKHAGIRHFRLDRERIEITAECETIDGYLEAFKWFDWLKKEIQDQMSNWQDIVPSRELGLLPTLGEIKLNLCGELQIINEGQRPQFSIDHEKAITLIQGSNLYSSKFACIRELLQNAVDATLICTWIKENKTNPADTWTSPNSAQKILDKYPVEAELIESNQKFDTPNTSRWTLRISDQGTGISREDLSFMVRIGASQKNRKRQENISNMPEWLKPSGAFGIGLQSAFLICETIKIDTKSLFTNESIEIIMHSPTGQNEGLIQIRELPNDPTRPHGTTIEISIELDNRINRSLGPDGFLTAQILSNYDPLLSKEVPFGGTQLADKIYEFSEFSHVPITATLQDKFGKKIELFHPQDRNKKNTAMSFLKIENQEVEIGYKIAHKSYFENELKAFYRGQKFECREIYIPHLAVTINLLSGSAGSWLNASRDKISSHSHKDLKKLILECIKHKITQDLTNNLIPNEQLPLLSLAIEAIKNQHGCEWPGSVKSIDRQWLKLPIESTTIEEHLKKDEILITHENSDADIRSCCDIVIPDKYDQVINLLMINEWRKKNRHTVKILSHHDIDTSNIISFDEGNSLEYIFSRHYFFNLKSSQQEIYSTNSITEGIIDTLKLGNTNKRVGIPLPQKEWEVLHLKNRKEINANYIFSRYLNKENFVLLPFLFTPNHRGGFKAHISEHHLNLVAQAIKPFLKDPTLSEPEITKAYKLLIQHIDNIFSKSEVSSEWRISRIGSEI